MEIKSILDPYLHRMIGYNKDTGEILGAPVCIGGGHRTPYNKVYFNGEQIKVCNFAWYIITGKWPVGIIDHKDRNYLNDKFLNLREISLNENKRNRSKPYTSKNKYIGVRWEGTAKWRYRFVINGVTFSKAGFLTEKECALARDYHILELGEKFTTLNILIRE